MSETPLPEPLENFLQHPPNLPASAAMRGTLFKQSSALLPRRRAWQRWPVLAGIAASLVLGIVVAYFGLRTDDAPQIVERKSDPPPMTPNPQSPNEQLKSATPKEEPKLVEVAAPANPLDLEWAAFDAKDEKQRARLYFQAGDRYLEDYGDYESALRCYRQALQYADAQTRQIDMNDNWFVMALKNDRREH